MGDDKDKAALHASLRSMQLTERLDKILAALERIAARLEDPVAPPYNGPRLCSRCGRPSGGSSVCYSCAAAGN